MEMGKKIRDCMKRNGIRSKDLAKACGVTDSTVSHWVHGNARPRTAMLPKVACFLKTTPEYLLGTELDEEPEIAYARVMKCVKEHRKKWSERQKAEIINMLFGVIR